MRGIRKSQESRPRCERCRRASEDYMSDRAKVHAKEVIEGSSEYEPQEAFLWRCLPHPPETLGEKWEAAGAREIDWQECETCPEFDESPWNWPLMVEEIALGDIEMDKPLGADIGDMVRVRTCDDGKTYLGFMVGEMPKAMSASFKDGELDVKATYHNPLILIPSEHRLVYGYESWWQKIKDASELEEITDEEIENLPYMRALSAIFE